LFIGLQAIAREDKGWLRGVEYNRSPQTIFATSRKNVNMNAVDVARPAKEEQLTGQVAAVQVHMVQADDFRLPQKIISRTLLCICFSELLFNQTFLLL
jgi:hypothetical protein